MESAFAEFSTHKPKALLSLHCLSTDLLLPSLIGHWTRNIKYYFYGQSIKNFSFCKGCKAMFWESRFRKETGLKNKKIPQPNIRNLLMKYQASTHYLKCYSICFSQMFLLKLIFSIKSKYLNTDLNLCPSLFSDRCFQLQTAIHFPRDTVTWTSQEHWEQCQPPLPRVQFLNLTIHTSEIIKKINKMLRLSVNLCCSKIIWRHISGQPKHSC